eukprot:13477824-Alexandrium_andersonii.AAC.1
MGRKRSATCAVATGMPVAKSRAAWVEVIALPLCSSLQGSKAIGHLPSRHCGDRRAAGRIQSCTDG